MAADGEGTVAQRALVEKAVEEKKKALVEKKQALVDKAAEEEEEEEEARVEEKHALMGKAAEEKEGTTASSEESVNNQKKTRKGDDDKPPASSDKEEAGKRDQEKAPAPAPVKEDEAEKSDEKLASPEEEAGKRGDQNKAPANKEEAGDDEKMLASAEEAAAKGDKAAPSAVKEAAANDEDEAADAVAPRLPLDTVVQIVSRLPSKPAARCALLSSEGRLRENFFFKAHLSPRCRYFPRDDDPNLPSTIVLQPAADGLRQGYNHLTIVTPRGNSNVIFHMPVRAAAADDDENDRRYYDYAIPSDVGDGPQLTPPLFFYKTVPALDLSILASDGRLMLAHSPENGLFLCNPSDDRFVRLPAPLVDIDSRRTTAAIRNQLGSWGEINLFDVVLLSPLPSGHFVLQRYSATDGGGHGDGGWVLTDISEESLVGILAGVSAPGIYAGESNAFYWIDDHTGSLIQYVIADHFISVVPPPPDTDAYPSRMGWSLGCTDGLPRLSLFSVPVETLAFDEIGNINGILSVWLKNQTGWVMVKEVSVPVAWAFQVYRRLELPVDMARAKSEVLMVRKDHEVLWRDLMRDEVQFISNLYLRTDVKLYRMYDRFHAFSV